MDVGSGNVVPLVAPCPSGKALADLQGIEIDLEHVANCCREWLNLAESDNILRKALLDSATIRYRRCFGKGVRAKIGHDSIKSLKGVDVTLHQHFLSLADKYVAHSVNAIENLVSVVIPGDEQNPTLGHMVIAFDFGMESSDRVTAFIKLLEKISTDIISPRRASLEVAFEQEVALLTHEVVAKLVKLSVPSNLATPDLAIRR